MNLDNIFSGDNKSEGIDDSMSPEERMNDYIDFMNEPVNEDELSWAMAEFGPNAYKFIK